MTGIIFLLNLEYIPSIKKYTAELEQKGEEFEVIYWERLVSDYSVPWNTVVYKNHRDLNDSKLVKLISFFKFRKFLLKTLKEKKYEKLIIMTTLTGMSIGDYLVKHYKGRFIFDIRDYTFEKNKVFTFFERKIIEASYFTAISSDGFKKFLPKSDKYVMSHNILPEEVLEANEFKQEKDDNTINITFIGAVRHFDINKEMADQFGNDIRYKLFFHGYGASYTKLRDYCSGRYNNVFLTGKYNRCDKMKLIKDASIINSYYAAENYTNKFLLSNKYYDALIYRIPLWANPNIYLGQRSIERGIGINVLLDNNVSDNIKAALEALDWDRFYKNCSEELERILDEDLIFRNKLQEFLQYKVH